MRKAQILLIEDETDVLLINKEYLETKGYGVHCTQSIAQARQLLETEKPDVVVLDVMLPDGNGFDFCREIKKTTTVPVIYLTCRDESESVVQGLALGADDYITKPYDLKVLEARIAVQLRRSGRFLGGLIELPPLEMDMMTGRATLDGKEILLSQKEQQLLAFFVVFAGQRFTAQQLYEHVWGAPALNTSSTVKVHISSLRKKLGMGEENSCFEITMTKNKEYIFNKIRY